MSVELVCVDPEKIFDFWPYARPLIKAALERTRLSNIEDIEADVLDNSVVIGGEFLSVFSDDLRIFFGDFKEKSFIFSCSILSMLEYGICIGHLFQELP